MFDSVTPSPTPAATDDGAADFVRLKTKPNDTHRVQ